MNPAVTPATTRNSTTVDSRTITTSTSAAGPTPPIVREQAAGGGQPGLLAAHYQRRHGPPCEIADRITAGCEALAAVQPELARLNAYNAMVMQVGDVRDDEKGRVIAMLLSQLVLLPEDARTDALRDAATLAGGASSDDQSYLYAQIARAGALLTPAERAAALRSMLLKAGSLGLDGRALLLAALAAALSSLPDAEPQKNLLTLLCSAIDRLPPALRLPALEALSAVALKSEALYLVVFDAARNGMQADPGLASFPLLSQLAGKLASLPGAARLGAFETLLGFCSNLCEDEQSDLKALLHDAVATLPDTQHGSARAAMAKGSAAAGAAAALSAAATPQPYDLTAYRDALGLACKGSPATRERRLCALAVDLDRLAPAERGAALSALIEVTAALAPVVRDRVLSRAAAEICMLAEGERLPLWSALAEVAGVLRERRQTLLLTALAGEIHILVEASRAMAYALLHRLGCPAAALSAAIACLPEQERIAAFRNAPTEAGLTDLPAARRYEGLLLLAGDEQCSMPALVRSLATLPAAALVPGLRLLAKKCGTNGDALAALVAGMAGYGERLPVVAIPLVLEAAILEGKDTYGQKTSGVDIDTWLAVLDFAVPFLLRQSEATLKTLVITGHQKLTDKADLVPAKLVIETCQLLRSKLTDIEKDKALRNMKPEPLLYGAAQGNTSERFYGKYPSAHELAAFVAPLFHSGLPEPMVCAHLISKTTAGTDGKWHSALSNLLAIDKIYLFDPLFRLILQSGLSSGARCDVLEGLSNDPALGEFSTFASLAYQNRWKDQYNKDDRKPTQIMQVLESDLDPADKTRLLLGYAKPASDKSPLKSSALHTALLSQKTGFLNKYIYQIANSTLPDECKVQLLTGCHADGSNKKDFMAVMTAVTPEWRKWYADLIKSSSLPDAVKQELSRYC